MQGCSGGVVLLGDESPRWKGIGKPAPRGFAKQAGIKHPRDAPAVHLDADEQISELAFPS
jgi:hypothetical protein